MKNVGIVILAAGESRRMGTSKQLLEINGKSLLGSTVELVGKLGDRKTVVVLGANAEAHQEIIRQYPGISSVVNTSWKNGLGSSIKAGLVDILRADARIDATFFLVCDQPLLSLSHLERILLAYESTDATVIASGYAETQGVPALFDKKHFSELLTLDDSEGAKRIIEKQLGAKTVVPFPEGKVDLDTPDDVRSFLDNLGK